MSPRILLGLISSFGDENVDAPRQTPLHLHTPTRLLGFDGQVASETIFVFSLISHSQSNPGQCLSARVFAGCVCVLAFVASCHKSTPAKAR